MTGTEGSTTFQNTSGGISGRWGSETTCHGNANIPALTVHFRVCGANAAIVLNLDTGQISDICFPQAVAGSPVLIFPSTPAALQNRHWCVTSLKKALFIELTSFIMYLHTLLHYLFLFYKFTEARCNFYLLLYNIVVYWTLTCPLMSSLRVQD